MPKHDDIPDEPFYSIWSAKMLLRGALTHDMPHSIGIHVTIALDAVDKAMTELDELEKEKI